MRRSSGVSAVSVVVALAVITAGLLAIVGWDSAQAAKADRKCQASEHAEPPTYEKSRTPDCGSRK